MIADAVKMLIALIGLVVAVGGVIVWTGAYNVAASEPHYAMTISLFATARDRAISVRAHWINWALGTVTLKKEGG